MLQLGWSKHQIASRLAQLVKNPPVMWEDSIPGWEDPGEGKGYTLQYSGLENSMDCIVHGVAKSQTQLSDFHFHFQAPNSAEFGKHQIPPQLWAVPHLLQVW